MNEALFELLKLSAVGLVSGLFSLRLGARQHVRNRWWEQRLEAYTRVVEALWDVFNIEDLELEGLDPLLGGRVRAATDIENERLRARARDADQEVRKASHAGAFLLSPAAVSIIDRYLRSVRQFVLTKHHVDYPDEVAEYRQLAQNCLARFIEQGRRDLDLETNWKRIFSRRARKEDRA